MGIINSNINKDSKDRSFLYIFTSFLTFSLSRCSIGPTGQFTIGSSSSNTSFLLPSSSQLTAASRFNTTIHNETEQTIPNESEPTLHGDANHQSSLFDDEIPAIQESSIQPPPNESIQPPEQPTDFDNDDHFDLPEGIPSESEPEIPVEKNLWALVDAFDEKANQSIPYSRGNVFMTKKDILKKLEKHKQLSSSSGQTQSLHEAEDLCYVYPNDEFYVFK